MKTKNGKEFVSYTLFAFTEQEIKRLLDSCESMSDYIMILLASRYGFRREDIVSIRIPDIDLEHGTITYYEHKKDKNRTIPIEPDVIIELKRYINTIPREKRTGHLLAITDGSTAWVHLQNLCKTAGIPVPEGRTGRPFHSLRGTCIKLRLKKGWSIHEVAALIGDEPETVSKHYAVTSPSELAEKMRCPISC